MKTSITKAALLISLISACTCFAQNTTYTGNSFTTTTTETRVDRKNRDAYNSDDRLSDSTTRTDGTPILRRKNVINVNITSMFISHFGISYERVITNKVSLRLYADYATLDMDVNKYDMKMEGFGILPEFRYYVSKMGAPYNYFIGVYGVIRRYSLTGNFEDDGKKYAGSGRLNYYGFGFVNGPQFVIGNRVTLAIPFGISFGGGNTTGNFVATDPSNTNRTKNANIPFIGGASIMPRFGIELGIAF